MSSQSQKGGDHSTNIQANQVTLIQGPTLSEVREIAHEVFKANFYSLGGEAAEIARSRAEQITEKYFQKLEEQGEGGFRQAKEPDFQYALFTVQKEYAKTGDKELGDLLVDLLVDRTKEENRTILQIVLNEALKVAPKLTNDQLAILSVIFLIKHTKILGISSPSHLLEYLDKYWEPFIKQLAENDTNYRHLEYCGCATVPPFMGYNLASRFLELYPGMFSKGFEPGELGRREIAIKVDSGMFVKCFHDNDKIQINATDEGVIRDKATELQINDSDTEKLIALNKEVLMDHVKVNDYLKRTKPYMGTLFDFLERSLLKQVTLTSVGIAIGHANVKKNLGQFTDLSIWVN